MSSGFLFGGAFTRRPTVRARVDDFGLTPFTIGTPRVVALIGKAEGGEPGVPRLFSSPTDAVKTLRRGELVTALKRCFDPSAEFPGATQVLATRVNPATPATLMLLDGAAANAVLLTSKNWGLEENQLKAKVETGSAGAPLKKLTLAKGTTLYVLDNLGRAAFTIQYVGAGSAATLTITGTTLSTSVTGGPGGENLNVALATYDTVQKLVDVIDAHAAYTASVVTTDPDQPTLNGLDFVTGQDIRTAAFTVRADLQAFIDGVNDGRQDLATATRPAGAGAPPANIGFTYFSGGSEGTTLTSHWQAVFDALQQHDLAFVVPLSSDAAIHAMADAHCALMSGNGRKPRRAFVGAALGEYTTTLGNYIARAQALNSDRTALVAQGVKGFDDAGAATTVAPYLVAAQLAGLQAGVPEIGDAITMRTIRATGLEWTPTASELELLLAAGILPLELAENRGFFRVTRGITTWLKSDAFHRVEISTGMALDEVVRAVIEGLEVFLGQKASPILAHRIASRTESILLALQQAGIIVGDATIGTPAFRAIEVSISGDTALVSFECSPAVPLNFIGVTVSAQLFEATISVAVAA